MRWPKYALNGCWWIFIWGWTPAQEAAVQMKDGSMFQVHDSVTGLEWMKNEEKLILLKGYFGTSSTYFVYLYQEMGKDKLYDPLADLEKHLLVQQCWEPAQNPTSRRGMEIRSGKDEGSCKGRSVATAKKRHPNGWVSFFLLGPQDTFYAAMPAFVDMVNGFQPGPAQLETQTSTWLILMAVGMLVFNIAIIWFGFREMARKKKDALA